MLCVCVCIYLAYNEFGISCVNSFLAPLLLSSVMVRKELLGTLGSILPDLAPTPLSRSWTPLGKTAVFSSMILLPL